MLFFEHFGLCLGCLRGLLSVGLLFFLVMDVCCSVLGFPLALR